MSKEIRKKTIASLFNETLSGQKTFDVRLSDWQCEPGDTLILEEIDETTKAYTGRFIRKKIGYVFYTNETNFFSKKDIEKHGLQIISLIEENE